MSSTMQLIKSQAPAHYVALGRIRNKIDALWASTPRSVYEIARDGSDVMLLIEAGLMLKAKALTIPTQRSSVQVAPLRQTWSPRGSEPVFFESLAAWDSLRENDDLGALAVDEEERMSPFDRSYEKVMEAAAFQTEALQESFLLERDDPARLTAADQWNAWQSERLACFVKHCEQGYVKSTVYGPRLLFNARAFHKVNERGMVSDYLTLTYSVRDLHSNERESNIPGVVMAQDDLEDAAWSTVLPAYSTHEHLPLDGNPESDIKAAAEHPHAVLVEKVRLIVEASESDAAFHCRKHKARTQLVHDTAKARWLSDSHYADVVLSSQAKDTVLVGMARDTTVVSHTVSPEEAKRLVDRTRTVLGWSKPMVLAGPLTDAEKAVTASPYRRTARRAALFV